jgi:ribosomal protein S12 methylthiotransferase accessory factor
VAAEEKTFRLSSCIKHYTVDQDKVVKPAETVKKALESLKKRFDLSNVRIERREDAIEGAYSFSSLSDQLNASGKGLTPEQSQASAIMEFTERYSWLHFDYAGYEGYTVKSYNEIKKGNVPTVDESYFLCNFIDLKDPRELLEEIKNMPLKWIKGISLMDYNKFYYPINWHNYIFTSNGLATGNALEEAILQALCEVIERENVYRLFGDRKVANDLDLNSLDHPMIRRVLDNAKKSAIRMVVKDISFDLGIPTFVAFGINPADKDGLTYKGCGYGTHPDPEKAVIRCLTEYFEGYSLLKKTEKEVRIDWKTTMGRLPARNYGFLPLYNPEMLLKRKKIVKLKDIPNLSCRDIKEEIERCLKILSDQKYTVILIDKTHPEMEIPVVRIFVPGMRSLMVTETRDPWLIMSEVYYEAGNEKASDKYLHKSILRSPFSLPPSFEALAKPDKIFKKDYKETILFYGGLKKNALEALKLYSKVAESYRPYD